MAVVMIEVASPCCGVEAHVGGGDAVPVRSLRAVTYTTDSHGTPRVAQSSGDLDLSAVHVPIPLSDLL
jgi:hypothetical protein